MQGLRVTKTPSTNSKLVGDRKGIPFYASYRAVGPTCPSSCPLLDNGCYAQGGRVAMQQRDRYGLDDGTVHREACRSLPQGAIVRLHVSGDVMLNDELDEPYLLDLILAANERPDITFYGYTHAWRVIDRDRFPFPANLVINASCESFEDAEEAKGLGWDVTVVVPSTTAWRRQELTVICPEQSSGISCYDCRLCMKPGRRLDVAFKAHGSVRRVDALLAA